MGGKKLDIGELRQLFSDNKIHIAIGIIKELGLASDRSVLRVKVSVFPDEIEMICKMSWPQVGPDAGIFAFPAENDLVLVAFADGSEDQAFVISRLTSKEDKIPIQAVDRNTVVRALSGKKAELLSDTGVILGRGGEIDPAQPVVLGAVFQAAYSEDLQKTAEHKHIGNMGYFTAVPDNASSFTALKASPVDDNEMNSDISFTEK